MSTFNAIIREILGMFVDDGSLAFAVLAVVAIVYGLSFEFADYPYLAGGSLFVGCLVVLVENIARTARKS